MPNINKFEAPIANEAPIAPYFGAKNTPHITVVTAVATVKRALYFNLLVANSSVDSIG